MSEPIFVAGCPRSGTSLTAAVLHLCGAWVGRTTGPSRWNIKGNYENTELRERVVKPYLSKVGACPAGLKELPAPGAAFQTDPQALRDRVMGAIRRQGYRRGVWLFKDCKLTLIWELWAAAFPEARWVVVERNPEDVVASCLRAEPMTRRKGDDPDVWRAWVDAYRDRMADIPGHRVVPERDILGGCGIRDVVEDLGLRWRPERVASFVDRGLWHGVG